MDSLVPLLWGSREGDRSVLEVSVGGVSVAGPAAVGGDGAAGGG